MNAQDENRDVFATHCFDPFPEPQTIPSGWDTSGLYAAPASDSLTEAITAAESESC
jgi:hypothetical protein